MSFYSGNGVDEYITGRLPGFGYSCEVGANNGISTSNGLHFEEKGWIVLCIEPNPDLEAEGRERRKLWRQIALGDHDGETEFTIVDPYPYGSSSAIELRSPLGERSRKIVRVQLRRLDRVLEEAGFPRLDLLTIDVEGWEDEVLAGIDLERWKPRIIVLEDWDHKRRAIPNYNWLAEFEYDNVYERQHA